MDSAPLTFRDDLLLVEAILTHGGQTLALPEILVDTGAASTVINADLAGQLGIFAGPHDRIRALRGVGGREFVFIRVVDQLAVGSHAISDFELEIGEMDYGIPLSGILGIDFLRAARAVIDLRDLTLRFGT